MVGLLVGLRVRRVDDDAVVPVAGTINEDLVGAFWVRWDDPPRESFEWKDELMPWGPLRLVRE